MLPTSSSAGNAAWAACDLEAFAAACAKAALDAAQAVPTFCAPTSDAVVHEPATREGGRRIGDGFMPATAGVA